MVAVDSKVLGPESGYVGRDVCLLSGGERANACLLRALYQKKQIPIMDEPFESIDRETEIELQRFLSERDITLFEVTHNRNESILSCFNYIIEIEDGNISKHFSPDAYFKFVKIQTNRFRNLLNLR